MNLASWFGQDCGRTGQPSCSSCNPVGNGAGVIRLDRLAPASAATQGRAMKCAWCVAVVWMLGVVTQLVAQIVAEPAEVDLGRRAQNQNAEASVVLVNRGDREVVIEDVLTDCSCTAGTPTKRRLAPGEKTELTVRTETRSYQGEITRRLVLKTSAGEVVVPLKVLVTPYENWAISPPFLTFAKSMRGEEFSGEVRLDYLGEGNADVAKIEAEHAWFAGEVSRREGKSFWLKLTKLTSAPAGHHMVRVTAVTNDATNPRVSFNVFLSVESSLRVSPSPVILPTTKVGKETSTRVTLTGWRSPKEPRFELEPGRATVAAKSAETIEIEVATTPEKPGALTQLLRVYDGEVLELEVPVISRAN